MSGLNVENVDTGCKIQEAIEDNVCNLHDSDTNTISKNPNKKQPRIQNYSGSFVKKMIILIREFVFIILLVVTYATFQNNTPKVSKSPNAYPFFPSGSAVKDWYRGQLTEAITQSSASDLSFVMYYAPWDAESQAIRHEFMVASQHMGKYVHFAAINCWQPGSECHSQYSKVYFWPVLMVYPSHGRGVPYKGLRTAEHMIKFLKSVINPITRISDVSERYLYKALHDAVVIAYVDASPGSKDYGILYTTALRFLERDPMNEIPFLVITKRTTVPTSNLIDNNYLPELHLDLWNETLKYPTENEWKPEAILPWIFDNLQQTSIWANPQGGKAYYLNDYINQGPSLILFTPRNPLFDFISYYSALQEVALEYNDCQDKILFRLLIKQNREFGIAENKYRDLLKKCSVNSKVQPIKVVPTVTYSVPNILLNTTCSRKLDDLSVCPNLYKPNEDKCENMIDYHINRKLKIHIKEKEKSEKQPGYKNENTWTLPENEDRRSPENLQKIYENDKCRFFKLAYDLHPGIFIQRDATEENENIVKGMACKTNTSISLIAVDSLQFFYFAERLGIDVLSKKDKTAVVILNPKLETHHIMEQPFTIQNLRNFIFNFTNNNLKRTVVASLNMPNYKPSETKQNITVRTWQKKIEELSTETFLPTVLQPNKVVIIMYYSSKCSFCSGVSHVLLSISRLLSPVSRLHFARIDGDINSLPWEYTMHHFPTILFFPAQRKSESRAFPYNVPVTIQNVLSFLLANVEPEMRLHIIWTLCKQSKFDTDLQTCARTLRIESTLLVSKLLREYRSTNNIRQSATVFKRLQHIRLLQFIFATPAKLRSATIQQHMTMLYFNSLPDNNILHEKL